MFFKETGYNCLDLTYSTHHCCLAEGVLTPLSPPTNPLIECLSMAIYPQAFLKVSLSICHHPGMLLEVLYVNY